MPIDLFSTPLGVVLPKFGLFQFKQVLAKLETKPFGFRELFSNLNQFLPKLIQTVCKWFKTVWNGLKQLGLGLQMFRVTNV